MNKILTIVSGAPSGALNIAITIADYLRQFSDSQVVLRKYNKAGLSGVQVVKDRVVVDYILNLYLLLKRLRPDIVLVHGYSTHLWTKIATGILGIKLIHVEHNVERYTLFRRWLLNMLDKYTLCYVCVSNGVAGHLMEHGIPKEKVVVIYNGIDVERFKIEKQPQPIFTIGMTARFTAQKDQMTLIKAIEILVKEKGLALQLILQGEGKTKARCIEYVREHSLSEVIKFETGRFLDLAPRLDLFVLSTNWEGLPLVLCEAMASKIPIISSNVAGVNEIIEHGKNGFLVNANDVQHLAFTIENCYACENREQLTNRAYLDVNNKFSIQRMNAEYKCLIDTEMNDR